MASLLHSTDLGLPKDTYILSLTPLSTTLASISTDDTLSFFDPLTLKTTSQIKSCHTGVTALSKPGPGAASEQIFTGGRDGLVKCWRAGEGAPALQLKGNGQGISAVATRDHLVAAGTENTKDGPGDVAVLVWDLRSPTAPLRTYTESHTDTLTALTFHPTTPSTILSASTDGLLTLYDAAHADEDDAVRQVFNLGGAVHCAAFLGAGDEVFAVSSDEQCVVYGVAKEAEVEDEGVAALETKLGDVRGVLGVGYVVGLGDGSEGAWIAGGDTEKQSLIITPLRPAPSRRPTDYALDPTSSLSLPGAHADEIVRDVHLDLPSSRAWTCGEDGIVRVWALPGARDAEMEVDDAKADRKERKKRRKEKRDAKERFKPY